MAFSQLLITNISAGPLRLNIFLGVQGMGPMIGDVLAPGGQVDVASKTTYEELTAHPVVKRLRGIDPVGTALITVTASSTADDQDLALTTIAGTVYNPAGSLALQTPSAGKVVQINSITKAFTTSSNIGFQAKPGQSVSMANNVIGGEISPRVNDAVALTGSGSIIGLHVDTYLKGTTGDIAGDVRGMQIEMVDDTGSSRTVAGDAVGLRFRSNLSATVTGTVMPIRVDAAEGTTNWEALCKLPQVASVFSATGTVSATQVGAIKVIVGSTVGFMPIYDGFTP